MGFKVKKRTAVIQFEEGTEFDGAEIKCLFDVPLKTLFEYQRLASEGTTEAAEEAYRRFGDEIITEWNLEEEDGTPIPATGEGLLSQSPALANAALSKWMEALSVPVAPKGSPSPASSTSAAAETATAT